MSLCCVIGGAGFVGARVVNALLTEGHDVRVVDLEPPQFDLIHRVEYRAGDVADPACAASALEGAHNAIYLAHAGHPGVGVREPLREIVDNINIAGAFLNTAVKAKLDRLVVVSSGGVIYGEARELPIPEDHATTPISPYGIGKLAIERFADMLCKTAGLPAVTVRPGNAFGERQRPFVGQGFVATAIASILTGRELVLFGESGTVRDYTYIDDMARGIVAGLRGEVGGCYNVGTGIGRNNREILDALAPLAAASGHRVEIVVKPARPFDVRANVLDIRRLSARTGWAPTVPFVEALRRTWDWYVRQAR